jgi:hypothetical protein
MRYIVVTCASLNAATSEDDQDSGEPGLDEALLEIASYEGQPLLFDNIHDAEDYMDMQDISVEMVVIEAPEELPGIIIT